MTKPTNDLREQILAITEFTREIAVDGKRGYQRPETICEVRLDKLETLLARRQNELIDLILGQLPEEWKLNIKTTAGVYKPPETASHPIEYWEGKNAALSEVTALLNKMKGEK